jgi:uncharacterized membrane protein
VGQAASRWLSVIGKPQEPWRKPGLIVVSSFFVLPFDLYCVTARLLVLSCRRNLAGEDNMAFCASCGQEIGNASFCSKCGAAQGVASTGASPTGTAAAVAPAVASPTEGLAENVAGLLCYILGWITGIIFLLIDKRPWVRFQAAQSIAVFGGLTVIRIALGVMSTMIGGLIGFGVLAMIGMLVGLVGLVLWIFLMVKAFKHENFRVPVAASIADSIAK